MALNCSTMNYCFSILIGITKVMDCLGREAAEGVALRMEKNSGSMVFQYTLHIFF